MLRRFARIVEGGGTGRSNLFVGGFASIKTYVRLAVGPGLGSYTRGSWRHNMTIPLEMPFRPFCRRRGPKHGAPSVQRDVTNVEPF